MSIVAVSPPQQAISLKRFNPIERFVYGLGRDDYELTVSPSPDHKGALIVTHSDSGRVLLTVPPIVPARDHWVGVAGAAINDWVREHGKDKAHEMLKALSTPVVADAPHNQGSVRRYCGKLWSRISAFFSSLARR